MHDCIVMGPCATDTCAPLSDCDGYSLSLLLSLLSFILSAHSSPTFSIVQAPPYLLVTTSSHRSWSTAGQRDISADNIIMSEQGGHLVCSFRSLLFLLLTIQESTSSSSRMKISKSSRPAWALAWKKGETYVRQPTRQPLWVAPERPQSPGLPERPDLPPMRSSSSLSNHLTKEQQDVQAMSNDLAGRRALGENRQSTTAERDLTPGQTPLAVAPAVSVHAWDDDDGKVSASTRTRMGIRSPAMTEHGTRYPRFEPSRVHEEMVLKETIRPPTFGGRSKNMQLGSVAESWGTPPTLEVPRGMFQLDDDPPSPPCGKNLTPEEIQAEKARRALLGIPGEKSGRPSIKDMTKEVEERLKNQRLKDDGRRSEAPGRGVGTVLAAWDPADRY